MHPQLIDELPMVAEVIDDILTDNIIIDEQYFQTIEKYIDNEQQMNGNEYKQEMKIIQNIRDLCSEMKGNYFEYRGLSIVRQIFIDLMRNGTIKNDFKLLTNDMLMIDCQNYHMLQESEMKEKNKFSVPFLTSIFNTNERYISLGMNDMKVYMICVLALQNSIATLMECVDEEISQPSNIPLAGGSCLIYDPKKFNEVLYWRIHKTPAFFLVNMYGTK